MNLSLSMDQNLDQSMDLSQRIEMRTALLERVQYVMHDIRGGGPGNPEDLIERVVGDVIESVDSTELKNGLSDLFKNKNLISSIIENFDGLAVPTKSKVAKTVIDFIYTENHGGKFLSEEKDENGLVVKSKEYETTKADLLSAYLEPDKIKIRLDEMLNLAKTLDVKFVGAGMVSGIKGLKDALSVAEVLRSQVDVIVNSLTYIVLKKDEDGEPKLGSFIKDSVILKRLTDVSSNRLVNRFITRCESVGQSKKADQVKESFMNVVGEFSLIATGVISKEMFEVQRGEVDQEVYDKNKRELAEVGIDLDALMTHYNLNTSGGFYWSRWKTLNGKTSSITDQKIRDFLNIIRKDEKDILNMLNFEDFLNKIREINSNSDMNKVDKKKEFENLFEEIFSNEDFKSSLIKLIRDKWYVEILKF